MNALGILVNLSHYGRQCDEGHATAPISWRRCVTRDRNGQCSASNWGESSRRLGGCDGLTITGYAKGLAAAEQRS
jgi:hypothetical protein